jgi:hypothetical protein
MAIANFVVVVGQFIDEQLNAGVGYVNFTPTDLAQVNVTGYPSSLGALSSITVDLDTQGQFKAELLAMDNTGITGWTWMCSGQVNNFIIPSRLLTINYANGAEQDLRVLIAAGTLVT